MVSIEFPCAAENGCLYYYEKRLLFPVFCGEWFIVSFKLKVLSFKLLCILLSFFKFGDIVMNKSRLLEACAKTIIVSVMLCMAMPTISFAASNRIHYNNQDLFLNGSNLAWQNFADDIGPDPNTPDMNFFDDVFSQFAANGGNCMRLWLHTNGRNTPAWEGFTVTGPGTNTIADLQTILDDAWSHKVSVMCCLWSFDMLRQHYGSTITDRANAILTDDPCRQSYINNCLIPMVRALKGHPAIVAWEIFNEPEGMTKEFGWKDVNRVPMASIQKFVNTCASAIHRTDPNALVTNGTLSFATNSDVGPGNKNYYTDARLIAAGGDPEGFLDFYTVHFYDWMGTPRSPFTHPCSYWKLDKPLVVAEFLPPVGEVSLKADPPPGCKGCGTTPYETIYKGGYAGALAWAWTERDSNHAFILGQMKDMRTAHQSDVEIIKKQ
jgi:hypothetical protein